MAITRANIAADVLQKLFQIEGGAVPEASDEAVVLTVLNSRVEALRDHGVAWWDDDDIPLQVRDALADYITGFVCTQFITETMEVGKYRQLSKEGDMEIRRLAANKAEGAPTRALYF